METTQWKGGLGFIAKGADLKDMDLDVEGERVVPPTPRLSNAAKAFLRDQGPSFHVLIELASMETDWFAPLWKSLTPFPDR